MKKITLLTAIMLMVALFAFAGASAEEVFTTEDGFQWILTEDETAQLVGYDGEVTGLLDIPYDVKDEDYNYYEVTSIADSAFAGCGMEVLYIGDNITEIGDEAFKGCENLVEVSFMANVDWISRSCFEGCTALDDIYFEDDLSSIRDRAFYGCTSLVGLNLSSSSYDGDMVASIGESAFENCTGLEYARLYNYWGEIEERAFAGCTRLVDVKFENTDFFEDYAFAGCTNLEDVLIPNDMAGGFFEHTFEGCDKLTLRVFSGSNAELSAKEYGIPYETIDLVDAETGLIYRIDEGMDCAVILDCPNSVSGKVIIPDELDDYVVEEIAFGAFSGNYNITEVIISDNVYRIGSGAFAYSSVSSVEMPTYVSDACSGMFFWCENLTRVVMPDEMNEIGRDMFAGCTALTHVQLPGNVRFINHHAFSGCDALEKLFLPPSVNDINEFAFENCENLTLQVFRNTEAHWFCDLYEFNYEFADEVDEATGLFYGIYGGEAYVLGYDGTLAGALVIPSTISGYPVTYIGQNAFSDMPITSVTLPEGLTYIDYEAFSGTDITSITLPSTMEDMQGAVFSGCDKLTDVTLTGNMEYLPYRTFENCTALKEITIPEGVYSIDIYAFDGCTALEKVYLPVSMEDISPESFPGSENLTLYLRENSYAEEFALEYGYNYEIVGVAEPDVSEYLVYNISEDGEVTITGIHDTFSGELVIPDEIDDCIVVAIDEYAFRGNTAITKVVVPEYCYWIGMYAFENCTNLTEVVLPDDLNRIDGCAFEGCTSLKSINLPKDLIVLGGSAFAECSSLEEITLPPYLTKISDCTFYACSSLKEITIPDDVTSLGYELFYGCTALEKVVIPAGVTTFNGSEVFADCPNVTLYIYTDSPAQTYADRYGIDYVLVDGEEIEDDPDATPASNFTYYSTGDGVMITGFNEEYEGNIVIPSTLDGQPVVGIDSWAFEHYYGGDSVTIPATVTYLADYAFGDSNLYFVTFLGSECNFGEDVFSDPYWTIIFAPKDSDAIAYAMENGIRYAYPGDEAENGFEYMVGDGAAYISGYNGTPSGDIVIPAAIGGQPMTVILAGAFKGCTEITSVYIPDSVEEIYESAFEGCTGLKSVRFSEEMFYMRARAFYGCTALEAIDLPDTLEDIQTKVFMNCTSLKTVMMPEGMHNGYASCIFPSAFEGCTALETVSFPENAEWAEIRERAFANCVNMTSFLENSENCIFSIFDEAFLNCAKLEYLDIQSNFWEIGEDAFKGCDSLTLKVYYNSLAMRYAQENNIPYVLKDKLTDDDLYYFVDQYGEVTITGALVFSQGDTLVIPETIDGHTVTRIGENAFKGESYKTIVLPDTLTYVAYYAFADCTQLTEINLVPTYYEGYAFSGCTSLKSAIFPEGTEEAIWEGMFENCTALECVHIPDSVHYIGNHSFAGCTALKEITGGINIENIYECAFENCSALTGLFLPESLEFLEYDAFDGCDNLVLKVVEGSYVHTMCENLNLRYELVGTSVESGIVYYIVDGSAYVNGYTDDLPADLIVPATLGGYPVKTIDTEAFQNAPITSVTVSEGVKSIGAYAFYESDVESAVLPESLTSMGECVFADCEYLAEVNIPAGIVNVPYCAFQNCGALKEIVIPEGIEEIHWNAFASCYSMTSVSLPDTVTHLGTGVFVGCNSLESIELPEGITSIEDELFSMCSSLKEVVIPDGVDIIWHKAFADCPAFEKVVIPESVTRIDGDVFENSDNVVLYVYEGSFAHEWAVNNEREFVLIEVVKPDSFAGVPDIVYLPAGVSFSLKLSAQPEGADMPEVTYETVDASVATVTTDGVITATGAGDAYITISGGGVTEYVNIVVDDMPVMKLPKAIRIIDEEAFADAASIRILDLRECDSVEIAAGAFSDVVKLRTVLLPENAVINPAAFAESDMTVFLCATDAQYTQLTNLGFICCKTEF